MSKRSRGTRPTERSTGELIELADRLHSAALHLLRRLRREDPAMGLPAPQASALSVVVFRGPLTLGALAQAEQVRPPSMTRVVLALEQAGLVRRTPDPEDRRVVLVRATPKGRRVLNEGRRHRVAALAEALNELSAANLRDLTRALAVLESVVGKRHYPLSGRG